MADVGFVFDRSLYQPAGVQAAVEAYTDHVGGIDVEETAEAVTVTLRDVHDAYRDLIADSFANHALFETILHARGTGGGGAA